MRAAEEALIAAGSSVDALMAIAGHGAAEYVWRAAGHRRVTVLTGRGNNGGDGWVIAETLRQKGGAVVVLAACEPKTDAARNARAAYGGVESDSGACLNDGLPDYQLTVSLGAWKFAHFLMPAAAKMGALRLVGIGCGAVAGAASVVRQPALHAPAPDAHKYRRGLLGVVAGAMPGAAVLAARAAQGSGAGYVKLLAANAPAAVPADLVLEAGDLAGHLHDPRFSALLAGPGLGRDRSALLRLEAVLNAARPTVLDADALMLLRPDMPRGAALIATPHEGELAALERAFSLPSAGSKVARAQALARASGMVIVAKGPDTVIAAPDGRVVCAPRASSWLSTAGTGDVLAGCIASRLACGLEAFAAAGEGVWLHGEAARAAPKPFSASALAEAVPGAYSAAL